MKPFIFNKLELFNEFLVSIYLVTTILLTDYNTNQSLKNLAAFVLLGILGTSALANLSKVFYQLFIKLRSKWR